MSGQWKPGDVAMVTGRWIRTEDHTERYAVKRPAGWRSRSGVPIADYEASVVRPLAVIDPENPEQVERLRDALPADWGLTEDAGTRAETFVAVQAALREFANPKPEEPTGLGAVVEDAEGMDWHRTAEGRWIAADGLRTRASGWGDIDAVAVIFHGTEPLADWERDLLRGES